MPYFLKFTYAGNDRWADERGSVFYFCNLGGFWHGKGDTRRLIERTSTQQKQAREFATIEEAREVLILTDNKVATPDEHGKVHGWQIVDGDGVAVK